MTTLRMRFSAAAPRYDAGAGVQKKAAGQMMALLPGDLSPRRILDLGCGSGQLTRLLRARWPDVTIHAVDVAEGMIAEAGRRKTEDRRLRWIVADAMTYHDPEAFNLVASNCALHWLHPLDAGLRHVASLVAPGGTLAFSIMLRGTLRELHEARQQAAPAKRPAAEMPSRELVETLLWQNGMTVHRAVSEETRSSSPSAHQALRTLHDQGLTGGALSRGRAPLTRTELRRLEQIYDEQYRLPDGSVSVTYHIGHFIAEKT